jgi:hypothetical protein
MASVPFDVRAEFAKIMRSKEVEALGGPNVHKILQAMRDPEFDGLNWGDGILVLELDPDMDNNLVDLEAEGHKPHKSYRYGIKGKVIGNLGRPLSSKVMFPDFWAQRGVEGHPRSSHDMRAFSMSLPVQEITPEMASRINDAPLGRIKNPKQAQAVLDWSLGNWKDSTSAVKDGGLSPKDYIAGINNSKYSATFDETNKYTVKKMQNENNLVMYQLGDSEVFFGMKDTDYSWATDELGVERAITGGVNNDRGSKGIGTATVLKGIEEGATALDAFDVRSEAYPTGFLPTYYAKLGFEEVARVPFDPNEVEGGPERIEDMKATWRQDGWSEEFGMPDRVIMKWTGEESDRQTATQDYLRFGKLRSQRGTVDVLSSPTENDTQRSDSLPGGESRSGQSVGSLNSGALQDDSRGTLSLGSVNPLLAEVSQFTDEDAANFNLDPRQVRRARGVLSQY